MAVKLAVGTTWQIASTYAAAATMSAVSNANPAVATLSASHGVVVGDLIHITSGWEGLNNQLLRVSVVATNDVTLEGFSTTDTTKYPAGSGTGSVREVTAWTEITQITRDYQVTGGDQQYADISTLKNRQDQRIPTSRSAVDVVLPIFHDATLAWYATVRAADGTVTGGRVIAPDNSRTMFTGYFSLGKVATVSDSTLRNAVAISFAADPAEYAT